MIPEHVSTICSRLSNVGFQAYVVGGACRDLIMGNEPNDWDIATDAKPEDVCELFHHTIKTGIQHGTVTVVIGEESCEVTTYRVDGDYSDGRHPDSVQFSSSIADDCMRRDFTVNGINYDPIKDEFIDLHGGRADITQQIIRCIGDPEQRFKEDALRMLRAVRFAARYGWHIEHNTLKAISNMASTVTLCSQERITSELDKIMCSPNPCVGLDYLALTGLLEHVLPQVHQCIGVTQNKYHSFDVYQHIRHAVEGINSGDDRIVRWAVLFHDIAKPACKTSDETGVHFLMHEEVGAEMTQRIMRNMKFDNDTIESVVGLVRYHIFKWEDHWKDSTVRRLLRNVGSEEQLYRLLRLRRCDIIGKGGNQQDKLDALYKIGIQFDKVIADNSAIHITDLKVDGNDVMNIRGIRPCKTVGLILNSLLEKVIEYPELNERETLIALIHSYKEEQ